MRRTEKFFSFFFILFFTCATFWHIHPTTFVSEKRTKQYLNNI